MCSGRVVSKSLHLVSLGETHTDLTGSGKAACADGETPNKTHQCCWEASKPGEGEQYISMGEPEWEEGVSVVGS
jgi:hypothetical protein